MAETRGAESARGASQLRAPSQETWLATGSGAQPSPGLPKPEHEIRLLRQFAPILQLHPKDESHPAPVEWYLERCQLYKGDNTLAFADGGPIIAPEFGRTDTSALADSAPLERLGWRMKIVAGKERET